MNAQYWFELNPRTRNTYFYFISNIWSKWEIREYCPAEKIYCISCPPMPYLSLPSIWELREWD